uniref:Ras-related protein rab-2a n=1 Tax=Triatoma infestans TaxID=30076 RepID=A0A161MGG8_TRIIF
MKTWGNLV